MRPPLPACLVLGLIAGLAVAPTGQATRPAPSLPEAAAAYLRDPVGGAAALIEAARRDSAALNPLYTILLSDAALRIGHPDVAKELALALGQGATDPGMASAVEMMLAWTALARGRLPEASAHLDAVGTINPALRSITDVALGLVAAARGTRDGPAMLAAAAARPDLDPAWREIALLLDAYARYWAGDAPGAADAFTGFAVANPGSRFADDALYAAAQAKRRAGLTSEAHADLEALAGDGPKPDGVPRRLLVLAGRAVLREGVRLDRARGVRTPGRRFADLLDGDGVALARAALAARRAHDGSRTEPTESAGMLQEEGLRRRDDTRPGAVSGDASDPGPLAAARRTNATPPSEDASAGREDEAAAATATTRDGRAWLAALAAVAVLLALAVRRLGRRGSGAV